MSSLTMVLTDLIHGKHSLLRDLAWCVPKPNLVERVTSNCGRRVTLNLMYLFFFGRSCLVLLLYRSVYFCTLLFRYNKKRKKGEVGSFPSDLLKKVVERVCRIQKPTKSHLAAMFKNILPSKSKVLAHPSLLDLFMFYRNYQHKLF